MKKIMFTLICITYCITAMAISTNTPQLIVQIVVDQLRGDLLNETQHEFGPKGFNYLLKHSINYQNAHHPHALTVTCVGHASIATGSTPSLHGIVANDWYDSSQKKHIYCTEDPNAPILPTIRTKTLSIGQSPQYLMSSTFGDELILAQHGRAFSVSLKDRAAITLAGHAGKAFWFDKENGGFISSRYYYKHYPNWVDDWNKAYHPKNEIWNLMSPQKSYRFRKLPPIQPSHFQSFGITFPHSLGSPDLPGYYNNLAMSPFADELTADFAMTLLKKEHLGQAKNKTDYLAISFSVVDVIGHRFSPNSLESEDNLKRLDQTIANLLTTIDSEVGLKNSLIILTADHGSPDSPYWLAKNHIKPIPALNTTDLRQTLNKLLLTQFNLSADAIVLIDPPYIYLNHPLLAKQKKTISEVAAYLSESLQQDPHLFTIYPLPLVGLFKNWLSDKVDKMNFPGRSGDLYIVPKSYQNISNSTEAMISHGSPWNYDSYVPLLFVNPNFKPTHITRWVYITDIASTLTGLVNIKPPSASIGNPLSEVIHQYDNMNENS